MAADLQEQYYTQVPDADIEGRSAQSLRAAAQSHYELAGFRPQGTSRVRVLMPDDGESGWDVEGHGVVEIVTEDRPFLVDSVSAFLSRSGFGIYRLAHPQLVVRRDITGELQGVEPRDTPIDGVTVLRESWMHIELDTAIEPETFAGLEEGLQQILRDVQDVVEDWTKMQNQALGMVEGLRSGEPPVGEAEVTEACELLSWLADGHFTFMGYREYRLVTDDDGDQLHVVPGTGLGILRSDRARSGAFSSLPVQVRAQAREKNLLIVTKANSRSTVHRPVYLDYISIKTFDAAGETTGERRFLGLFTSSAYTESVTRIPVLGRKVDAILERLQAERNSYNGKALIDMMETYPRDELFQTSIEDLTRIASSILQLRDRRQLRLFVRPDDYGRFVSCLVYLPRDRYTTAVRLRIQRVLADAVGGDATVDYTTWVTEDVLARVHFVVRPERGTVIGDLDEADLQRKLAKASRSWDDDFADAVEEALGEATPSSTPARDAGRFPEAYKEDFDAHTAVADLQRLQELHAGDGADDIALELTRVPEEPDAGQQAATGRLKILRVGSPLSLADVLPLFASLGLEVVDERPYHLRGSGTTGAAQEPAWIYDFGLAYHGSLDFALLQDAFLACWRGDAEADGFNRLVTQAAMTWRQVIVMRTYAKFLRQAGTPFSQNYIEQVLLDNAEIAAMLVSLFEARFDPAASGEAEGGDSLDERAQQIAEFEEPLAAAFEEVASLDADRILRAYRNLIRSTSRTNFYQREGGRAKPYVSIKLEPRSIDELPAPRPRYEIFCYSPRVEGVHLRFGAVARGGLRWSDRRDDFRTEVLGLVKAQMVKNAVIVPVGSKGGFYCKDLPDPAVDRDAWMAEGVACYRTFISSLLDLTDNRAGAETVPPADVVRWDGDDSYLVVAADKGTATFSDIANGVSAEYGFWLGDAFASGGSVGYDHKVMGITARGAWESVRRHFREMGVDCQHEDFTCVGIGDMSGDVFGNGMLLSEHTKLVAAFDHRHIFLDPDPDLASSYAERRRMFDLPRSSWADYDTSLLSEGGGVYARTLKSVPVSPQVRAALGLDEAVSAMTPAELLTALLKTPVDLLWNGGIGTYVKAESESHDDVGDKANNAIRVNGSQLRCRCVGEGGNLGLTQLGRIEYARAGGRINTDFIDNSAGVDTSDHEVNFKILLDAVVERGDLSVEERNGLLPTMTDEVGRLVLKDNYDQNVTIAGTVRDAPSLLHAHAGWVTRLERNGLLDREIEFLPSPKQIAARRAEGVGLTAPELAVLLAYTKIVLSEELLGSDVAEDPYFRSLLFSYFPTPLQHAYRDAMEQHPLRREIIVTRIVNDMINAAGLSFFHRLSGETGADAAELARAYAIASEIYDAQAVAEQINALDNVVSADTQEQMRGVLQAVTERATRWLVNHRRNPDVEATVEHFGTQVQRVLRELSDLLVGRERDGWQARADALTDKGVPEVIAVRFASFGTSFGVLPVVDFALRDDVDALQATAVHAELAERLGLDRLVGRIGALPRDDRWRTMARAALRDDLLSVAADLTGRVWSSTDASLPAHERVDRWADEEGTLLARAETTLEEIWADETPDLARLSVGLRIVRSLLG